jgi:hypothetical protein
LELALEAIYILEVVIFLDWSGVNLSSNPLHPASKSFDSRSSITDLISAVVELLRRDMNGLVETAREALEPIEPWDEG